MFSRPPKSPVANLLLCRLAAPNVPHLKEWRFSDWKIIKHSGAAADVILIRAHLQDGFQLVLGELVDMQGTGVSGMGAKDDNLSAARHPLDVEHGEVETLLDMRYDLWLVQGLHSTQTTFISSGATPPRFSARPEAHSVSSKSPPFYVCWVWLGSHCVCPCSWGSWERERTALRKTIY